MIKFVSASDAKIEMFNVDGDLIAICVSAEDVAQIVKAVGYDGAYYSSSMDFADEEGFDYASQAKEIFEAGVEMGLK